MVKNIILEESRGYDFLIGLNKFVTQEYLV